MKQTIVLDSAPLALLVHRPGISEREKCRDWFDRHMALRSRFYVPEIVHYELRRELLRLNKLDSLKALDILVNSVPERLLLLTSVDLHLAAELWARARQAGKPTADPHALDVDVILSAQVLNAVWPSKPIIATTNTKHLDQFVDARDWAAI